MRHKSICSTSVSLSLVIITKRVKQRRNDIAITATIEQDCKYFRRKFIQSNSNILTFYNKIKNSPSFQDKIRSKQVNKWQPYTFAKPFLIFVHFTRTNTNLSVSLSLVILTKRVKQRRNNITITATIL